jgi:hypothetical protein
VDVRFSIRDERGTFEHLSYRKAAICEVVRSDVRLCWSFTTHGSIHAGWASYS